MVKTPVVDPVIAWSLILFLPTAILFGAFLSSESAAVGLLLYTLLYFAGFFVLAAKRKRWACSKKLDSGKSQIGE